MIELALSSCADASPLVRSELAVALCRLVKGHRSHVKAAANVDFAAAKAESLRARASGRDAVSSGGSGSGPSLKKKHNRNSSFSNLIRSQ